MKTALFAAAASAALFATPALGLQGSAATSTTTDSRVNQLIVYGNDPCPRSTESEITVCARRPEGDRYRIPENLRDLDSPRSNSWANRADELSYVGRTGTESCSTVGPGGFTGCLRQVINAARAERQGADTVDWNRLIESARQERLGRIDADAEAIERESRRDD